MGVRTSSAVREKELFAVGTSFRSIGGSDYEEHIVEQDHRAIKRVTRPMLGLKTFRCARIIIGGIETMHMIRKNQLGDIKDQASSAANHFYSLAF